MRTKISILLILISLLGYSQQQPTWFGGGVRLYNATEQTSFSLGYERIPLMQTNGVINSFIHSDSLVVQSQIKPFITISDVPVYQAGSNITIDNTNPLSPIINASGSGGGSSNTFSNGITLLSGNAKIGGELIDLETRLNIDDNTKSFGIFANTFPSTSETIKTGVRIKGNELLLQAGLLSDSIQVNGRVKLKNFIDFRNGGSSTNIYFGTGYGAAQPEDIFISSTPSEPMIITVGDDATYDVTLKDNVFTSPNALVNKQYVDNAVSGVGGSGFVDLTTNQDISGDKKFLNFLQTTTIQNTGSISSTGNISTSGRLNTFGNALDFQTPGNSGSSTIVADISGATQHTLPPKTGVIAHLSDIPVFETQIPRTIDSSLSSLFSGFVIYSKNKYGMVTITLQFTLTSAMVNSGDNIIYTFPVGLRPTGSDMRVLCFPAGGVLNANVDPSRCVVFVSRNNGNVSVLNIDDVGKEYTVTFTYSSI